MKLETTGSRLAALLLSLTMIFQLVLPPASFGESLYDSYSQIPDNTSLAEVKIEEGEDGGNMVSAVSSQLAYASDANGTYPAAYAQSSSEVRNYDPVRLEYGEGWLTKYATQTDVPGEFYVDLKIEGKNSVENESTDIVLVIDNSNSMAVNNRITQAYDAASSFIDGLLNPGINSSGNIRMAMVSYGSDIFDGRSSYILDSYGYHRSTKTKNASYKTLTTDGSAIKSRLPATASNGYFGGSFTQAALREAQNILSTSTADNKVIVLLSDGIPSRSYEVTAIGPNTGSNVFVKYDTAGDLVNFPPQYKGTAFNYTASHQNIKGNGWYHYLNYQDYQTQHYPYTVTTSGVGSYTVADHGFATISEALKIKDAGTEIYGIGVELAEYASNGEAVSKEYAMSQLKNIASGEDHYFDAASASQITSILQSLANRITKSISGGSVVDPMGPMVTLKKGPDGCCHVTASSAQALNALAVSESGGQIAIGGVTLGEGEWVNIRYKVSLNTEDPSFAAEHYYQTNGRTYLYPKGDDPDRVIDFPVPSVKGPGVLIKGSKVWEDGDSPGRPGEVAVKLYRYSNDAPAASRVLVDEKAVSADDGWAFDFGVLPRYDGGGHEISYEVEETPVQGYVTEITSSVDTASAPAEKSYTVKNTLNIGAVEVLKLDRSDAANVKRLEGAQFELRRYHDAGALADEDGKKYDLVKSGVTGTGGKLSWPGVPFGDYSLVETAPPEGYNKLADSIPVTVDSYSQAVEVEVQNVEHGSFPATGGAGTEIFIAAGLGIGAIGLLLHRKLEKNTD